MVGNPHRWRAVIPQLENRNSTAGCLLALLFFLPLLTKAFHINVSVVVLFIVIYVSIIVPIGTGIISMKYVIGRIRKLSQVFFDDQQWNYYSTQISYMSSWVRYIYLQVDGVQAFTTQVIFNLGSEKLFCPTEQVSCLYVLLFYSFLAYVHRSLMERPWVRLLGGNLTAESLKLTTAFISVRLGKGVAVALAFLTFSYQFNHLKPTYTFFWMTFVFFCLTQYQNKGSFRSALVDWLTRLELQCFDGLEEHWIPVLIYSSSIGLSAVVFLGLILHTNNYIVLIILGQLWCFNIYLPFKYLLQPSWRLLSEQKCVISKYPLVSWSNPQVRNGYPCAICLDKMRILMARMTPCGHVFHGSCLRKCLQHSKQCPLCKTVL